jgi:hypothetical protein
MRLERGAVTQRVLILTCTFNNSLTTLGISCEAYTQRSYFIARCAMLCECVTSQLRPFINSESVFIIQTHSQEDTPEEIDTNSMHF